MHATVERSLLNVRYAKVSVVFLSGFFVRRDQILRDHTHEPLPHLWATPQVREPHCQELEKAAAQKIDGLPDCTVLRSNVRQARR